MNLNSSVCKNLQTGINLAAYKPNHELQFIFIKATGSLLCPPWMQSWYWFPCNITCLSTGIITITWASSGICQLSWSGNHSRLMCGNHGKSLCSITDDSAAVSIKTIRQLYLATAEFIGERGFPKYLGFISLNYLSLYWQIPGTVNTE